MVLLVYEIGGSTIRAALVDGPTLRIIKQARVATPNLHTHGHRGFAGIIAALNITLRDLALAVRGNTDPDGVAVGYPAPISPQGIALMSPTLLGAEYDRLIDVAKLASEATGNRRIIVMNDVTACGYRYVKDGYTDFALINVGSGIGNKIFIRGEPMTGPGGRGGEIGHFTVDPSPQAPLCECGGRGHLAGIASGRGVTRWIMAAALNDLENFRQSALGQTKDWADIDSIRIASAFREGDEWVARQVGEATRYLSQAIAGLHTGLGIETFILVGGFALALGARYREMLALQCAESSWSLGQDWNAMISLGEPGDEDGLIGLAFAAQMAFRTP